MSNALVQMPEKIEIDESSLTPTFGRFTVQPLEKGFGVTLGSSFRRVLLSSLPGTSTTAIRVDGIHHEFSTIKGVVEDVADLV
ncbi:DNA-directed RNA polymerase subunit alpha, partial [bacterium]